MGGFVQYTFLSYMHLFTELLCNEKFPSLLINRSFQFGHKIETTLQYEETLKRMKIYMA